MTARRDIRLPGGSVRFLATGEDHFASILTAQPGFAPTPHVHRLHEELFLVLEGTFDFLCGDEVLQLGPGGYVAVPPGVLHDFCNPGPGTARLFGVVTPGGAHEYFESVQSQHIAGTLTPKSLRDLRLRFDTDQVDLVWSP